MDKLALLASSWTKIASPYRLHFVPRFLPWIQDTCNALIDQKPDLSGTIFVPGCGTGDEIVMLAEKLPEALFVGLDLSEGMLEVAREVATVAGISDKVEFRIGDASTVPTAGVPLHFSPPFSAVFSCFALQQLPNPREALAAWTNALVPGGILVEDWESTVLEDALHLGSAQVLLDTSITHEMSWPSVEDFWERMTRDGPWYSRRVQLGDAYMEEAKRRFISLGKDDERNSEKMPLKHRPVARLIVLQRQITSCL